MYLLGFFRPRGFNVHQSPPTRGIFLWTGRHVAILQSHTRYTHEQSAYSNHELWSRMGWHPLRPREYVCQLPYRFRHKVCVKSITKSVQNPTEKLSAEFYCIRCQKLIDNHLTAISNIEESVVIRDTGK